MNLIYALVLALIGLAAIVIELFVPAAGLIGVVGLGCMIGSVSLAFIHYGTVTGSLFIIGMVILTPLVIVLWFKRFPHSRMGRSLILSDPAQTDEPAEIEKGSTGKAFTDLRPSGIVLIDRKKYSALTGGEYIHKGSGIEVVKIQGNRIEVRFLETNKPGG